jgi:CAP12/Pycsar effector protein, TIR domain/Prokaryotic STING domain
MNPTLFIGCSTEALKYARAIKKHLRSVAEVHVWDEGLFKLGDGTLSSLLKFADRFDFAAMVLAADDLVKSRNKRSLAPRDNVLFELGLFYGRLGPRRTFGICAADRPVKIPSDLKGIKLAAFPAPKKDKDIPKALKRPCKEIAAAIEEAYESHELGLLPSTALAVAYVENFLSPVHDALSSAKAVKIGGKMHDLTRCDTRLVVLLPDNLGPVLHRNIPQLLRRKGLQQLRVETASRAFPFSLSMLARTAPATPVWNSMTCPPSSRPLGG